VGEGSTDTPQGVGHGGGREASHVPVLLKEAIDFLNVRRGGTYIDATVGLGGHSYEIAKRLGAPGHLIGLDKDPAALEIAASPASTFGLRRLADDHAAAPVIRGNCKAGSGNRVSTAFLADIGVSSLATERCARGFSFQADGPLDMRMDPRSERTAEQVVNHLDERELADVIYEFGEERRSRRIARAIVRSRPIRSTAHLADVISAAARPMNSEQRRIHPATRTFQALRIFVNRELDDLKALLDAAPRILKPGGRVVVISFHSLEDRIVKDAFREGRN
jgi:16S rRNA (cytosine1402-N4)-methyltransferase